MQAFSPQLNTQLRDSPRKDLLDVELYVSQDDDIPPRRQDASATPSSDGAQAVEDFIEERIKVGKPNWESLLDRVRQSAEVLRSSPRPPSSHLNEKTQTYVEPRVAGVASRRLPSIDIFLLTVCFLLAPFIHPDRRSAFSAAVRAV